VPKGTTSDIVFFMYIMPTLEDRRPRASGLCLLSSYMLGIGVGGSNIHNTQGTDLFSTSGGSPRWRPEVLKKPSRALGLGREAIHFPHLGEQARAGAERVGQGVDPRLGSLQISAVRPLLRERDAKPLLDICAGVKNRWPNSRR
jgi:hypothetical protein